MMSSTILMVMVQILVAASIVDGQLYKYQPYRQAETTIYYTLQDQGVSDVHSVKPVGCADTRQTFPTNSTPLFNFETPYKKVDTNRDVADMFTDAIEAEGKEDVFDLNSSGLIRNTQAGTINIANIETWPFLQGKGVSIASFKAPPCSTGIPHFHTSHDELNYIITGSNITVGIKENLKPLNLMKNVKAGNVVLAPQGSIHFFINLSCTKVTEVIQIFPTELSSTTTIGSNIVSFPSEILTTAFNTDIDLTEALKETKLQEVEYLRLDSYCLKRCGLL